MQNKLLPLLGFFIISLLLYRRIFKERLPKEIVRTDDIVLFMINILLCIGTFFLVCLNVYTLVTFFYSKETKNINENSMFNLLKTCFQKLANQFLFISQSLIAFDIYIKNQIKFDYIDKIIMFIMDYFNKYKKFYIYLCMAITILFQNIVSISFFVDIFIYKKFYYFYCTLWLLIFPLMIKYLFYSIKVFLDTNFNSLEEVLILKMIKTSDYLQNKDENAAIKIKVNDWRNISKNVPLDTMICFNTLSPDYLKTRPFLDQEKTLDYCAKSMNDFLIIDSFLDQYDLLTKKIILLFNIFKHIIYTIGWGYLAYLAF